MITTMFGGVEEAWFGHIAFENSHNDTIEDAIPIPKFDREKKSQLSCRSVVMPTVYGGFSINAFVART